MTTKNDSLFRKGKQKLSYNNGSHSGQKFSNINLKQSLIPVKSNSKTHNENFNAAFNLPNSTASDHRFGKKKLHLGNKSQHLSNLPTFYGGTQEKVQSFLKINGQSDTSNNSIISLHIIAYENSNEAARASEKTATEHVSPQHSSNDYPSIRKFKEYKKYSVRSIQSVVGTPRSSSPATCLLTGLERTAYSFSPTSNLSANDSRDSADEDEWLKSDSTQRSDDRMPAASKNEIPSKNPAKNSSHRQKQHKAGRENCSGNENREPPQSKSSKVFKTWNIDQTKNGSDEVVKPGVSKDDVPSRATAIRRKELQYAKMDLEIAEIRNQASMKNLNTRVIDVYGKTVTETKIVVKEKKPKRAAKKKQKLD